LSCAARVRRGARRRDRQSTWVRSTGVRSTGVRSTGVCSTRVRTTGVWSTEVRSTGVRSTEVWSTAQGFCNCSKENRRGDKTRGTSQACAPSGRHLTGSPQSRG
jgi:hypothetical protein